MLLQIAKNSMFLQNLVAKIVGGLHPTIEHNLAKIELIKKALFHCELEKIELPKPLYKTCGEVGNEIREATTTYKNATDDVWQGNYTKDGKLFVGFRCE